MSPCPMATKSANRACSYRTKSNTMMKNGKMMPSPKCVKYLKKTSNAGACQLFTHKTTSPLSTNNCTGSNKSKYAA